MQYLRPVGAGPSSNTWPRCEPQFAHWTSVLRMKKKLRSDSSLMPSFFMGCQKLGQPVPESNLVSESKRGLPQTTHW